jgi:hypothetical protein
MVSKSRRDFAQNYLFFLLLTDFPNDYQEVRFLTVGLLHRRTHADGVVVITP